MLKQSICYPLFKDAAPTPDAFCALAADIGFAGIDLWGRDDIDVLAKPAKACGLAITGFVAHPIPKGLADPEQHEPTQTAIREAIDLAARHSIPTVIAFTGNRVRGQTDTDGLVQAARGLRPLAGYAEDKGVTICVELLNSKVDHPDYLADHSDFGFALCEMVDSPAVKLLFDIYHMQIMEGNVIVNLRRGMSHIGPIHTAGVPGRHELDDSQELNYRGIVQAIVEAGYDGFLGHELVAKGGKADAMRQSFELCAAAARSASPEAS